MKYYLLITLLIILYLPETIGQSRSHKETIYCEDGSVFVGKVLEDKNYELIFKLQSTDDVITIDKHIITKRFNVENYFIFKGGRYHKKHGSFSRLEYTLGGNAIDATSQFGFMRGKLLSPRLGVGLGVGFSVNSAINVTWNNLSYGELFLYSKYYLNDNRRRLFVDGKIGAAVPLASDDWLRYTAGPLVQPGIGIEFAGFKKIRWSFKISQFIQYSQIRPAPDSFGFFGGDLGNINVIDNRIFNRTLLGIGMSF